MQTVLGRLADFGAVAPRPVATGKFGGIHRKIGRLQQRLAVTGVTRIERRTKRAGHIRLLPAHRIGRGDHRDHGLGHAVNTLPDVRSGQDDNELVPPALTRHQVFGFDRVAQTRGQFGQHQIATGMPPHSVIDLLEAIKIDVQQRDFFVMVLRAGDGAAQPPLGQADPVGSSVRLSKCA